MDREMQGMKLRLFDPTLVRYRQRSGRRKYIISCSVVAIGFTESFCWCVYSLHENSLEEIINELSASRWTVVYYVSFGKFSTMKQYRTHKDGKKMTETKIWKAKRKSFKLK